MPCPHKFREDLNLERIQFEPTTLMVGTFNPSWPDRNNASWFYGRTARNYFWDVLPRLHNPNLNLRRGTHNEWKQFCETHLVALTDIITCINDADAGNPHHHDALNNYLDSEIAMRFNEFTFTDIPSLLDRHQTISNVYLTRQAGIELFDTQWQLVKQYANQNPRRNLHVRKLLTPSGSARFQMGTYLASHPNEPNPLRNFIYYSWRTQWHNHG